jgi:PKD repeat protein
VEFSGAASTDDDGVAHYLFDFGDGETSGWLADNSSWHSYQARGTYQARLRVQDRAGAESDWSDPVAIRVRDEPPSASISVFPRTGYAGTVFLFGSAAQDADGAVTSHEWNFGDGKGARGETVNHSFSTHGDFLVTLKVTDDASLTCQTAVTVTVLDLPPMPAISVNRSRAVVGEYVGFSASGSSDPDDPVSSLSYIWDFGDGQRSPGPEASYAYRRPGEYRVVLTASDGNLSAEVSMTVSVRPPAGQAAAPAGPGWQSWAVLAALILAMALVAASMIIPDKRKEPIQEEEE